METRFKTKHFLFNIVTNLKNNTVTNVNFQMITFVTTNKVL